MQLDAPDRVLANKTISIAGTADTDFVFVRGAKALMFIVTGSDTTNTFAAASSFQILVHAHETLAVPTAVATPSQFNLEIVNATNLDSATPSAGRVILVRPLDGKSIVMGAYKIAARLTGGAAAITDCDVYAVAVP